MDRSTEQLSEIVHHIYDASVHPERWLSVVATIAASFGSSKGLLFTPMLGPQQGGFVFPLGIKESALQVWATHYIDKDVWALGAKQRGLWLEGAAYVDDEMAAREEFLASPFYREFLQIQGIEFACVGIVFTGSADFPATALSVFRDGPDGPFDRKDVAWMRLLVGHLSRSLGLMIRLDNIQLQNASLLASHDRLNFGVALLNEHMQVLHMNKLARTVIERQDGIFIDGGRQLESLPASAQLQNASQRPTLSKSKALRPSLSSWLMAIRDAPLSEQQHFLDGCIVTRKRGVGCAQRYYVLQCAPVPVASSWRAGDEGDKSVRFVVFVTDPEAVQLPSIERLCALYGLTPTQARVCCEFAKGGTYKAVARRLKITEETVRAHVKEIYPKMRINRQAELVRAVLSMGKSAV